MTDIGVFGGIAFAINSSGVTYLVGKKGASKTATGTTSWTFKAKFKPGKTVITVIAHGYGGDSAPAKITVTRS